MLHHNREEFDDNFGRRPDKHLALSTLLSVVYALESVGEDIHSDHG